MRCLVYPSVSTLAGQPATAFPVGRSREGLPIGLQAIGPYLEDLTPIRFAALLAKEIGGFLPPDGFFSTPAPRPASPPCRLAPLSRGKNRGSPLLVVRIAPCPRLLRPVARGTHPEPAA